MQRSIACCFCVFVLCTLSVATRLVGNSGLPQSTTMFLDETLESRGFFDSLKNKAASVATNVQSKATAVAGAKAAELKNSAKAAAEAKAEEMKNSAKAAADDPDVDKPAGPDSSPPAEIDDPANQPSANDKLDLLDDETAEGSESVLDINGTAVNGTAGNGTNSSTVVEPPKPKDYHLDPMHTGIHLLSWRHSMPPKVKTVGGDIEAPVTLPSGLVVPDPINEGAGALVCPDLFTYDGSTCRDPCDCAQRSYCVNVPSPESPEKCFSGCGRHSPVMNHSWCYVRDVRCEMSNPSKWVPGERWVRCGEDATGGTASAFRVGNQIHQLEGKVRHLESRVNRTRRKAVAEVMSAYMLGGNSSNISGADSPAALTMRIRSRALQRVLAMASRQLKLLVQREAVLHNRTARLGALKVLRERQLWEQTNAQLKVEKMKQVLWLVKTKSATVEAKAAVQRRACTNVIEAWLKASHAAARAGKFQTSVTDGVREWRDATYNAFVRAAVPVRVLPEAAMLSLRQLPFGAAQPSDIALRQRQTMHFVRWAHVALREAETARDDCKYPSSLVRPAQKMSSHPDHFLWDDDPTGKTPYVVE